METTRYARSLAAPPAALALTPFGASRVKLVFTDEIAAFVQRQRGFSACWYLVPCTARLVGDLLHEIAQEFELLARCPFGLELLLDGFHVLANQEIGMVRDNDTLAVQCVAFVGEKDGVEKETRQRDKQVVKKRGRKQQEKEEDEHTVDLPVKKKSKQEKSVMKLVEKKTKKTKPTGQVLREKKTTEVVNVATEKKKPSNRKRIMSAAPVDSSSDDSSSSSSKSSSSSESSSSDEEVKGPLKPVVVKASKQALHQVVKQTVKSMKQDVSVLSSSGSDTSDSSSSSDSGSDDSSEDDKRKVPAVKAVVSGTQPKQVNGKPDGATETRTRRRRRPRRRPKSGDAAGPKGADGIKPTSGNQRKANGKKVSPSTTATTTTTALSQTDTKEIRPLRIRGVPLTAKNGRANHVRFDGSQQQPVAAQVETAASSVSSELDKYGPRSSNARKNNAQPKVSLPIPIDSIEDAETEEPVARKPVKEMWKRPYEIISSIHDVKKPTDAAQDLPSLDSFLAKLPTHPANASTLQTDDIIAYKTLTLCMETFQPIVSDWQCGQVVDVLQAERSVTLIPYSLVSPTNSIDELTWAPSQPHKGEDASGSVGLDDMTEVRLLHGPSKLLIESTTSK